MQIILRCHLPQTLTTTTTNHQPPTTNPAVGFTHPGHLNLRLQTPYIQRFGMAFQSRTAFNKPTEVARKAVRP